MRARHAAGRSRASARRRGLRSIALAAALAGCVHKRDFRAPEGRLLDGTAHALAQREVRLDVGVIGTGDPTFGANLGVSVGAHKHLQLGTNLAQDAFGLFNLRLKSNLIDRPKIGVALETGFFYTNPRLVWVLPADFREPLGDIHVFGAPLRVITTALAADWLHLNVGLSYTHVGVTGEVRFAGALADGSFGARSLDLSPVLQLLLGERVAVILGGEWALWSALYTNVEAEYPVTDGLRVGVRSAEWIPRGPLRGNSYYASIEARFGKRTNARASISYRLLGDHSPVELLPSLELYWRFGP
ncbi:MAG: hypothetical protein KC636_15980 [Myxococcales bacterium]|nr:hypothetical protein [Myxococcales bacterium]